MILKENGTRMWQWVPRGVAGLAIVAICFFGALFILSYTDQSARDALRVEHVQQIKSAVENYHNARRAYPTSLKALVDGGFLKSIPSDPLWAGTAKNYQYYSDGINNFGVLVVLERVHADVPAGKSCRTGLGTKESAMWGEQPQCPF
jgi:hypothetical protein